MKMSRGLAIFLGFAMGSWAVEPNEKAGRYHQLLLKRPESTTLFERFVDSWLDSDSKEDLEAFLKDSAAGGGAAEWRLLAAYQEWMGREEDAMEALDQALALDGENGELLMARAKLKSLMLDFEGALGDLEKAGAGAGEDAAALKGTWLARAGRPEEAVAAWKELLKANPDDEELREDLIELEVGEGLYDEAIATGRELAENTKDPYQRALRLMRVGAIEVMAGQRDEGVATYRTVLKMTGEDSWLEREALAQIEKVYRRDQDIAGLRKLYQDLREDFPQRVSLRKGLAAQMAANGEIDEAVALFREILKITPGDLKNREEFIALLESEGKYKDAVEELQVMIRGNEDQAEPWERMARLRDLMRDEDGLLQALERVRELRSGDAQGVVQVAALYQHYERADLAEELLREGMARFAEVVELKEALASHLVGSLDDEAKQEEATSLWLEMAEGADAEGVLRVARSLMANKRGTVAYALLAERIGDFPDNALLLNQLCQAALAAEKEEEAFPHAMALARLAKAPTELDAALKVVGTLGRRLDLQDVIDGCRAVEEKGLVDWCVISELESLRGDLIASDEALAKAQKLDDGLMVASQRVRNLERRGEITKAIGAMRELLERPGGRKPVHLRKLVDLLERDDKKEEALVEVDAWKQLAPGDKTAWLRRGELLEALGRPDEKVTEYRRALAKFGDEEELRAALAKALVHAGEYAEGERIYRKLYEQAEDFTAQNRWIQELSKLAKQEGRTDELIAEFERRKRTNSREAAPLMALAKIHEQLNNFAAQSEALDEAVRRKPQDVTLREELARVQEKAGDLNGALATLQEAVRQNPGPRSKEKLAAFCFRIGETDLGLEVLSGLQQGDPRAIEGTALNLGMSGEWGTVISYLDRDSYNDWRFDLLRGVAFFHEQEKEKAREIWRSVATVNNEIEGLKPAVDEKTLKKWVRYASRSASPETENEAARHNFLFAQASTLLREQDQNYGNRSRGSLIALPGTAEEARGMALALLLNDAKKEEGEDRQALIDAIPFPNTLFYEQLRNFDKLHDWILAELEAGRIELKDAVRRGGYDDEFPVELLKEAANTLVEVEPEVAAMACEILLRRLPNEGGMWVEKWIEILLKEPAEERAQKLGQIALLCLGDSSGMYRSHLYGYGRSTRIVVTRSTKEKVRKVLTDAVETGQTAGNEKERISQASQKLGWLEVLLQDAWQRGDAAETVRIFNHLLETNEVAFRGQKPGRVFYQGHFYPSSSFGGGRSRGLLSPPPYPNDRGSLPSVWGRLMLLSSNTDRRGNAGSQAMEGAAFYKKWEEAKRKKAAADPNAIEKLPGMNPDDFRKVISGLSSLEAQAMAWQWCKDEAKVQEAMGKMEESNEGEVLLAVAGYAAQQKDFEKSYEMLERARSISLDRNRRKEVDRYLIFVGAALAGEESERDLEQAKRACLRLQKDFRSEQQINELAESMRNLKMDEEARRLVRKLNRPSGRSVVRQGGRRQSESFSKLLVEGNEDGAVREALRLLRVFSRSQSNDWEQRQFLEVVQKSGLGEKVIELADPGPDSAVSRRIEFVKLCETLSLGDEGVPYLQALVESEPDNSRVQALAMVILPKEEGELNLEGLIAKGDVDAVGEVVLGLVGKSGRDGDETSVKAAVDLAVKFLEELEPSAEESASFYEQQRNLTWVNAIFFSLDGDYSRASEEEPDQENKLRENRLESLKSLATVALRHAQTANQGFAILEGCQEVLAIGEEEMREAAVQCLSHQNALNIDEYWYVRVGRSSSGYGRPKIAGRASDDWLMTYFAGVGDENLRNELWKKLTEATPARERLYSLSALLAGWGEGEVQQAMDEWEASLPQSQNEKAAEYAELLKMSYLAGISEEAAGSLEQECFSLLAQGQNFNNSKILPLCKQKLVAHGEEASVRMLDRYLTEIVGPNELWEEWAALKRDDALPQPLSSLGYHVQDLISSFQRGSNDLELYLRLHHHPLHTQNTSSHYLSRCLANLISRTSVEEAEKDLSELGLWTRSWSELGADLGGTTLWEQFASACNLNVKGGRSELADRIKKQGGGRQLLFVKRLEKEKVDLGKELGDYTDDFVTENASERAGLASILKPHFAELKEVKGQEQLSLLLEQLEQERNLGRMARIDALLNGGLDGINRDNHEECSEVIGLAAEAMAVDKGKAADLITGLLEFQVQPSWGYNSQQTENFLVQRSRSQFEDVMRKGHSAKVPMLDWIGFLEELFKHENARKIGLPDSSEYYFQERMLEFWRKQKKPEIFADEREKKLFKNSHWKDFPVFFADATPELKQAAVWYLYLREARNWNAKGMSGSYWDWMVEERFLEAEPDLAGALTAMLATRDWDALPEEGRAYAREALSSLFLNEDLSVVLRMEVACAAAVREDLLRDEALLNALAQLAGTFFSGDWHPGGARVGGLFKQLAQVELSTSKQAWVQVVGESKNLLSRASLEDNFSYYYGSLLKGSIFLACKLNEEEVLEELCRAGGPDLVGDLEMIQAFAGQGYSKLVNTLVQAPGLSYKSEGGKWNTKRKEAVDKLLPMIRNEAERYRIEVILSSLDDEKDFDGESREQRLIRLSEEFAQRASKVPQSQLQILAALLQESQVEQNLKDAIRAVCGRWTILQASGNQSVPGVEVRGLARVLGQAMQSEVRSGEMEITAKNMSLLAQQFLLSQNHYESSQSIRSLVPALLEGLIKRDLEKPTESLPDEFEEMTREWLEQVLSTGRNYNENYNSLTCLALQVALMQGRTREFFEWGEALDGKAGDSWDDYWKKKSLTPIKPFAEIPGWLNKDMAPYRRNWVSSLLGDPHVYENLLVDYWSLIKLVDWRLADSKGLTLALEKLPEDLPYLEKLRIELAAFPALRGKEAKKGLQNLRAIRDEGRSEGDGFKEAYALLVMLDYYAQKKPKGWKERAVALGEQLDWEHLDEGRRKHYQDEVAKWEKQAAEQAAKEEE
ncbi:tetratricopeptide repeat protein [Roseibacillus persicicus]|uniref:tetratricopeptide repeat protein n=1 Tax=Roseibacillus persicicus TaxID=454148 RepID=UPI00398A8471